jgi:TIR domain
MPEIAELLANVVRQCVQEGHRVTLEGLGTFGPDDHASGLRFIADSAPHVFIAYAVEDLHHAERLYAALYAAGLNPWMDKRKLLPGQNWRLAISRAIRRSDCFIPCFSQTSVRKRGQFPQELRTAIRTSDRMPLDDNFIFPVRLEECVVPARISAKYQYVDLFQDWEGGIVKLSDSIWKEFGKRLCRY